MKGGFRELCGMLILILGAGCSPFHEDGTTPEPEPSKEGSFSSPQDAIAVEEDTVVVSNTEFNSQTLGFGDGFLTVLDANSFQVMNRLAVSPPNPGNGVWEDSSGSSAPEPPFSRTRSRLLPFPTEHSSV